MRSRLEVLSNDECAQVHERSLQLLNEPGVQVLSGRARKILGDAGAAVDEDSQRVRFPRYLVEQSLKLAPRHFKLGARRPGWDLEMNTGKSWLVADGGAVSVLDWETGETRPGNFDDWFKATTLIDAIDEIGVYWNMVEVGIPNNGADFVGYYRNVFNNCSKHIQDSVESPAQARLLLEILGTTFGGRENVRSMHPFSYVLCPMSPLVLDDKYTDAWLETLGWDIPIAIMPMPLMGATAPASLLATLLVANVEVLAALALVQAASPGTPTIYAAVPQSVEPHTWRYTGGAIENALFGAAVAAMGRHYGLPVEASTGGTDQYYPGAQSGYERSLNWSLPILAWPDVLVGPGLLGGSTILCLEQLLIDVEVFRRCVRLHEGIPTSGQDWLQEVLETAGPGANFMGQRSTVQALRDGGFYLGAMGFHDTYEKWKAAGMPDIVDGIQDVMQDIVKQHQPLPLDPDIDRELEHLERSLRDTPQ